MKYSIPIILGTVRQGRSSEHVAKFLLKKIGENPEIETQIFDPRDMKLPADDEGQDIKDSAPEWRDAIIKADGLVMVVPEYNHGYPGSLKRVLDLLLDEYKHKPVAVAGVSMSPWGGTRVIEALTPVVRELGLSITDTDLNFSQVQNVFDESGNIIEEETWSKRADGFVSELLWMARALKWGRDNVKMEEAE
jgi:NAD(P)H-dependent FMN reductase